MSHQKYISNRFSSQDSASEACFTSARRAGYARTAVVSRLLVAIVLVTYALDCGGEMTAPRPSTPEARTCPPSPSGTCPQTAAQALGHADMEPSQWHPDPDGDGVRSDSDHCPDVYDPQQGDSDHDGVGDFCDEDFAPVVQNGPVVDLRAEHVTPYGGWFHFTSPKSTRYGQDYLLAWSRTPADLRNAKALRVIPSSSKKVFRVFADFGQKIAQPLIVTRMSPGATYYLRVTPLGDDDQPTELTGNLLRIKTAPEVLLQIPSESPRVLATQESLRALRTRQRKGDETWSQWAAIMGPSVLDAARSGTRFDFEKCLSAALLYHATKNSKYRAAALSLIEAMRRYWQGNELQNNLLRWADSNLALCADLMWQELTNAQRDAIVSAYLPDDEAASIERLVDTDEYASITRSWIVDGLLGCRARGVSAAHSKRACALLERGKRAFYGVQLVKARRNHGFFAQSGGNLPDGNGYALGTSKYWLQTLIVLGNVGGETNLYAPWVWHNLQAMQIQALSPRGLGLASFGDLDSYDNFSVEPNSLPLPPYNGGLVAMHMGLLERAGQVEQARRARWHLDTSFPKEAFGGTWAMLLFAHDSLPPLPNDGALPRAFYDQSMGMFYDRTSWDKNASFFVFRAGWSGADHAHEDAGAFQLYRNGTWLTHEDLGYDGPASQAGGHNVPLLDIIFTDDDQPQRPGQFNLVAAKPAQILKAHASARYSYVSADLSGAYSSARYHSFLYDTVDRQIFWLKRSKNNTDDRLYVYDRIAGRKGSLKGKRSWQLHIDSRAKLSGNRALFRAGASHVAVQVVLPAKSMVRYEPPQGRHSQYPGERYTSRLVVASGPASGIASEFLVSLHASDTDALPMASGFESETLVCVVDGDEAVIFHKSPRTNKESPASIRVPRAIVPKLWWTGLRPNTGYTISVKHEGEKSLLTATLGGKHTTDDAGVLAP